MSKLFTPLYDHILVQRDDEETVLKGGFIIPDASAEKPDQGTVLAVGHGRLLEGGVTVPLIVEVGDRIIFNRYAGTDVKIDGKTYIVMQEPEIYGIMLSEEKGEVSE